VKEAIRQQLLSRTSRRRWTSGSAGVKKDYCKKIGYQKGYARRRPGSLQDVVLDDGLEHTTR
jgi:hypothetical protein